MDRWNEFDELARRAREERPPHVDVTHRVLAAIASRSRRDSAAAGNRPMILCATGALLAASVVALLASSSWLALNDPFTDLLAGLAVLNP